VPACGLPASLPHSQCPEYRDEMGVYHRVQATYTLTVSIVLSALVIVKIDCKQYRDFTRMTITPDGFPASQDPFVGVWVIPAYEGYAHKIAPYPACTADG